MKSVSLKADLLLLLTALIWGTAFVAQRVGMEHVGPYTYNGVRFVLGALVLLPFIIRKERGRLGPALLAGPGLKRYALYGTVAGLFLFAGASLQQIGIVYTTAGKAGFITGLYVILVPLIGLAFRQRAGWGTWGGAVLAVLGLYFLSVTEAMTIEKGDLLVLIGAFFWAGHVVLLGYVSPLTDPLKLAFTQFSVCAVLSLVAGVSLETITWSGLWGGAFAIFWGGVLSVGVAYTLQVVAQRDANPAHAAILLSMETVFAALAGGLMLGEVLGMRGLVGCGLMLAGMLLSQLKP